MSPMCISVPPLPLHRTTAGCNATLPSSHCALPGSGPLGCAHSPARSAPVETLGLTGRSRLPLPTQAGTQLALRSSLGQDGLWLVVPVSEIDTLAHILPAGLGVHHLRENLQAIAVGVE